MNKTFSLLGVSTHEVMAHVYVKGALNETLTAQVAMLGIGNKEKIKQKMVKMNLKKYGVRRQCEWR